MRSLILLIILSTLTICSCRSNRQTLTEYADTSAVRLERRYDALTAEQLLKSVSSSGEMSFTGLRLDFFPPGATPSGGWGAPMTLTIDSAWARELTDSSIVKTAGTSAHETENLDSVASSGRTQSDHKSADVMRVPDWVVPLTVFVVILVVIGCVMFRIRSPV